MSWILFEKIINFVVVLATIVLATIFMIEFNLDIKPIGTCIGRVFRVLRNTLQKNFENSGNPLTLEEWLILLHLKIHDGITQQELCVEIVKEKTTVTRLIDGLEKKKLIVRVRDDKDRRNNLLYLTKKGKKVEKVLTPIAIETNKSALNDFSKSEIEKLSSFLNRMVENLSEKEDKG